MELYTTTAILFAALLVLLASGIPIAFALGTIGLATYILTQGMDSGLILLGQLSYRIPANFVMTTIPLFIFMGELLIIGGVAAELFEAANKLMGRLPGGLAIASVAACAVFGAICGSPTASVATIGVVAVPEMLRRGYDPRLAAGVVAAASALAPIIPPSILMILYAVMTEQSIGKVFMGGVVPGLLMTAIMMVQIVIQVKMGWNIAPPSPSYGWKERIVGLRGTIWAVILIILVLGTIYLGIGTPTEAAALGAFGALIIALAKRKISWRNLGGALLRTVKTTSFVLIILVMGAVFSTTLNVLRIPDQLAGIIIGLSVSPWVIMGAIQFFYILLGTLLDPASMIVVTIPVLYPLVLALGFDPVWFGVSLTVNFAIAQITPPMALNLYVMAATVKEVSLKDVSLGSLPFAIAELITLALIMAFPILVMWLPNMMG